MLESKGAASSATPPAEAGRGRPGADDPSADGPLRVAMFSGNYNYMLDGAARSQNRLVGHLIARGHQALVFAPTIGTAAFAHEGTLVPVPSIALPGRRGEYRVGLGLRRRHWARLDAFRPDLIHIATPDLTAMFALRYAKRRGIPAVASFHTRFDTYGRYYRMAWIERYLTRYMRWIYNRCLQVYPPTLSMLEELRAAGIGRELRIWGRGVDHALYSPERRDLAWRRGLGVADDEVVVAFVGRLVLEKGIEVFAEALRLARARRPRLNALVVGGGPERERFEALLPDAVFIGHQEGEALARAYASADIFLNPSTTETAGNVTLEAMAAGLACVTADVTGSRSIVREGETGLLVPPAEGAAGYAERLVALADDAGRRAAMGAAGRALTLAEHNWPDVLDNVITHYREALTAWRAARSPEAARDWEGRSVPADGEA